jgi:hypothetical protein
MSRNYEVMDGDIIEIARGDVFVGCFFLDCEFVGRGAVFNDCKFQVTAEGKNCTVASGCTYTQCLFLSPPSKD